MFRRFSIQIKIVLPYTLLFAAVIAMISFITIRMVSRRIDERIERQMERAAEAMSSMGFILSDDFLSRIRINEVIGADIIAYRTDRSVIATTLPRDSLDELMPIIYLSGEQPQTEGEPLVRDVRYLNQPYKVIYRKYKELDGKDYVILSLMVSTEDIDIVKKRSAMIIALSALSGVVLVTAIGIIIAGGIIAPVKQLVRMTERVASGDLSAQSSVKTHDEIGILARSFDQMTKELKISRDKLVQSEKLAAIGQLSAGIAHEIRNPLTSMKMILQLLRKKVDESLQESVQVVLDEISKLEIVINSLLDFARPMELVLEPVDISVVIDDVIRLMEANLRHRKIELVKYIDGSLPEIMIDASRMRQAIMNIILNSMEAMPNGGVLTIRCYRVNLSLKIEIADTGGGMRKEVLDHAFEPFFSARPGGTGIGLTNVKKIVEQHGGSVHIESAEGQGTKVIINLNIQALREEQ